METIVEIVGLAMKIDIVLTNGILTGMLTKSKTEVFTKVSKIVEDKTIESKIVLTTEEYKIVEHIVSIVDEANSGAEEERGYNMVDEVVDTSINDVRE